jgi:transposase-like protein
MTPPSAQELERPNLPLKENAAGIFDQEIIVVLRTMVLTFSWSYRHRVRMMAARDITLTHTTMKSREPTARRSGRCYTRVLIA